MQKVLHVEGIPQSLFVGVDVGKNSHIAGILSPGLLRQHRQVYACPTIKIDNSRSGFEKLKTAMAAYAPPGECSVLMERTGHYHHALRQYLTECGIDVYEIHPHERMSKNKTDKRDALGLANTLYSQIGLGVQVTDSDQAVHHYAKESAVAGALRSLVRHRHELSLEIVQRLNRLTSICDELFPEFSQILANVNCNVALIIRERFPTPAAIAQADFADLVACRPFRGSPSNAKLERMQTLAAQTIGTKESNRISGLCVEQSHLIAELRLLTAHRDELDARIAQVTESSREGKILTSLPCVSTLEAAAIIASIGCIGNFASAAKLKGHFGWAPQTSQSGESLDSVKLTKAGSRLMKKTLYLLTWRCIREDTEWRDLYERLVPVKCRWDERTQSYRGKNKVIGRVAGQVISMIYVFLRRDYDLLCSLEDGATLPDPVLYDREVHRKHREGSRRP